MGLATAALIFASCAKDETTSVNQNNPDAIGFDLSTGKTRAVTSNLATLQGDANGFGVYATNGATPAEFIGNKAYKYNNSAWAWADEDIMWPSTTAGYPVNFYAYHPLSETTLSTTLTASYTIGATIAAQKDLLAANHTNVVARPSSSDVTLNFKHMLSKVDFKVVAGAAETVEVQSIAVKNAGSVRTFDYSTLAWATAAATTPASFSYMTAPAKTANQWDGDGTTANVVTSDETNGSLMLMPQDFSTIAWDPESATAEADLTSKSYIEVVYRIFETTSEKNVVGYTDATDHPQYATLGSDVTGNLFVKVGYSLPTEWLMGKAFTYTIYLGTPNASGGNLVFPNFIEDDGSDSGLPVVSPGTGEGKDVPDPIFDTDEPIGFVVSVDDWTNANGVDLK